MLFRSCSHCHRAEGEENPSQEEAEEAPRWPEEVEGEQGSVTGTVAAAAARQLVDSTGSTQRSFDSHRRQRKGRTRSIAHTGRCSPSGFLLPTLWMSEQSE